MHGFMLCVYIILVIVIIGSVRLHNGSILCCGCLIMNDHSNTRYNYVQRERRKKFPWFVELKTRSIGTGEEKWKTVLGVPVNYAAAGAFLSDVFICRLYSEAGGMVSALE